MWILKILTKRFLHSLCPCFDIAFAQLGVIPRTRNRFGEIVAVAERYLIITHVYLSFVCFSITKEVVIPNVPKLLNCGPSAPWCLTCLHALLVFPPSHLTCLCALRAFVPLCLWALRALAPYVPWSLCALITRLASIIWAFKCLSLLLKTILEHSKRKKGNWKGTVFEM